MTTPPAALHYTPAANAEGLRQLSEQLRHDLSQWPLAADTLDSVLLIVEELLANTIEHGFDQQPPERRRVELHLRPRESRLELEFRDNARAYDPLQRPAPDLDADILDRPIGGLGVHLIKELSVGLSYRRDRGDNVLTCLLDR